MVRLVDVRRIDYDGRHNAFTDLAAWRGQYYLTFRLGTSHKSRDGRIVLLQSSDLSNWSEAKVIATGADDRDPKLLPTERRLFLQHFACGASWRPMVSWTDDGFRWSEPEPCVPPDRVVWRPRRGPDGTYYVAVHTRAKPEVPLRRVVLCRSEDGTHWEDVSQIYSSAECNETDIEFANDGSLVALVRDATGPHNQPAEGAALAFSRAPYREWSYSDPGVNCQGPALANIRGCLYAAARKCRWNARGERIPSVTVIHALDGGMLHQLLTLSGAGDCSYPAFLHLGGGDTAMSYYSSHESGTSVYLARLRMDPPPGGYGYLSNPGPAPPNG